MCSTLPCPLCCQPNFPNVDSLRISLVNVTQRPLSCPICADILLGLDKLTIHLFSHTLLDVSVQHNSGPPSHLNVTIVETCPDTDPPLAQSPPQQQQQNVIKSECSSNNLTTNALPPPPPPPPPPPSTPPQPLSNEICTPAIAAEEPLCYLCGFSFRNQELQQMHMRLVHEIENDDDDDELISIGAPRRSLPPLLKNRQQHHACHLCAKWFKMKGSLRVHLRVVHFVGLPSAENSSGEIASELGDEGAATDGPIDDQNASAAAATTFSVNAETKLWECDICAKSFTTKYFLKKHKRLHTGEMPYTCEICGKTFTFQQSYHKHLLYHNDDKPHQCGTCGRAFKELSTLHNHERIHSGEKPFKCETCDKCFRQRVSYLVHRRIHTGVMPYKCTACEKSFRYKVSQRTHKCLAQPPGMVVRQTGDLLQRLMQSNALTDADGNNDDAVDDGADGNNGDGRLVDELPASSSLDDHQMHAMTTLPTTSTDGKIVVAFSGGQSLDDFVAEHCEKIGICDDDGGNGPSGQQAVYADGTGGRLVMQPNDIETQIPSPSDKFQNLCLYSPPPDDEVYQSALETIDEAVFKQFLYGTGM